MEKRIIKAGTELPVERRIFIPLLCVVGFVLLGGLTSGASGKLWDECEKLPFWAGSGSSGSGSGSGSNSGSSHQNGQSSSDIALNCHLRTINSEFERVNFSSEISSENGADTVISLSLTCSDVIFYQSSLESESLSHLHRLASLHIEHCKLSRLDPLVFSGLSALKNLTIRTYNTAWPALSLEIAAGVFSQTPSLEKIDLSANNIWTFPDKVLCPLNTSLESLNVSLNRLQDIGDLSFRESNSNSNSPDKEQFPPTVKKSQLLLDKEGQVKTDKNPGSGVSGSSSLSSGISSSSSSSSCRMGLQILDVSQNRLILLPSRGLSSLAHLRELYLQGNEISNVADRALAGLKSLRILNLSDNKMVALPTALFQESRDLSEIYLQNNSLSSIPPALFAQLNQLVVLDLSYNILNTLEDRWPGSSVGSNSNSNSSGPFSGLIRLVLLKLGHNRLTSLKPSIFGDLYSLQILNVEHNQIQVIEPNTFAAMSNLHTLLLSHNKLTFVSATALNGLFVLSTLSLDNNAIASLHPTAFHNCSSLKDLNLNGNAFTATPAALQNLTLLKTVDLGENTIDQLDSPRLIGLPQLYGLRLTGNRVVNVSRDALKDLPSLKILNLARNRIQAVEPGAFDSNTNLQAVRLDANYLTDISGIFGQSPGVSGGERTPNLIWLNISDNHLSWFTYSLIPKQLQWLDLHKNAIVELDIFTPELPPSTQADSQGQGQGSGVGQSQSKSISKGNNKNNDGSAKNTLDEFRLQTLDVSYNRITRVTAANIPDSIENLFLNDNLINFVEPHTFYKKTNCSHVDLSTNQIETMDLKALQLAPFPGEKALPEFYLAGNPLICSCEMEWLQRINKLDHLRQHPRVMDLDSVYCKLVYHRKAMFVPLAEASASNFLCSYKHHCFALCTCCEFACDCAQSCPDNCLCFHDDTWSSNIVDCALKNHQKIPPRIPMDATEIYLDGNSLEELSSHVFIGRKNLRVLFLNNSGISIISNNSFSGLKKLEILHLENNYLTELQGYEFEPLENARELYLHGNQLRYIGNDTFSNLKKLEVLKLDGNALTRFSMWALSSNPYLVEIGLSDNPWSCDCEFVSVAAPWIKVNLPKLMDASEVNCLMNQRSLSLVYMNGTKCSEITALSGFVEARESALPPYLPLLAGVMAVCLVVGSLFVAVCRKSSRRSLRAVWAHSKCPLSAPCYSTTLEGPDGDREKLYDAYIAYSLKDENWVSQVLQAELQSQGQLQGQGQGQGQITGQLQGNTYFDPSGSGPYRLCLHYKDFPVSSFISDTILEAVESSRRTIIVLSKNFIQSEWCRFEFKSALHAALRGKKMGSRLIAVTLGDLPTRDLDPDLRVCLRSATVLSSNDKLFWSKLRQALGQGQGISLGHGNGNGHSHSHGHNGNIVSPYSVNVNSTLAMNMTRAHNHINNLNSVVNSINSNNHNNHNNHHSSVVNSSANGVGGGNGTNIMTLPHHQQLHNYHLHGSNGNLNMANLNGHPLNNSMNMNIMMNGGLVPPYHASTTARNSGSGINVNVSGPGSGPTVNAMNLTMSNGLTLGPANNNHSGTLGRMYQHQPPFPAPRRPPPPTPTWTS